MTKRKLLISILLFLVYALVVWFGTGFFLTDTTRFLVAFVLIVLGLTVLIVYLLIAKMRPGAPAPAAEGSGGTGGSGGERTPTAQASSSDPELAALAGLITEANNRLAKSPKLASRRVKTTVTGLPLFLIGGTEGVGKTSTFLKSGLEPELLAGQVFRDANILPTRLANLWFAEDCLFAELSGTAFSGDPGRWNGLLARLQGKSAGGFLKRIFGGKSQAQLRGFILFCDISPFLGVPDPTRLGGLSRRIQERLRQVGESFGTNFPVYVIFTKSDALPYFKEYFARLVENEDQQILGATLPAVAPGARPAGEVYAESETARLADSFNTLYYSLSEKRLTVLPRETSPAAKPAIYEFPREVKRVRDTLVQFLVDVFRPNPLQPGPILRGYYFTGTRQVTVSTLSPASANEPVARASSGEATMLWNVAEYQKKMGLIDTPASSTEQVVPRWCFVGELFNRVILRDPMGQVVAYASRRQDMYKRIAFGAASAFGLLVALLWLRSWWNNAGLLNDIHDAAGMTYAFQPSAHAIPSLDTLRGLDALREQLQTLLDYDRNGPPWRMRWGLYAGNRALLSVYELYFQRFRQLFFDDIHNSIFTRLRSLPPQPDQTNSYDAIYDRLKAYRMITQCKCTPDPAFLTPVLNDTWLAGRTPDPERQALILKQLSFYAAELKEKNPYKVEENKDAVDRGRLYLSSFGGIDRQYRSIIEEANRSPRVPARLADLAPNYKQVLSTPGEVMAAFTRDGWNFVGGAIKDPSRLSAGDPCVLGVTNIGAQLLQGSQAESQLRNLYVQEYIRRWKDFTHATTLDPFRNLADTTKKLEILADNRSPLLGAIFMISDNTNFPAAPGAPPPSQVTNAVGRLLPTSARRAADAAKQAQALAAASSAVPLTVGDIARVFQPAREVVSPNNRDRWIDDPNRTYMNALADLQRAMQRISDDHGSNPDLALHAQARQITDTGMDAVRQIAQKFNFATSQGVDGDLKSLLESPFHESLKYIITDPTKVTKEKAGGAVKQFCARLLPLEKKFPFNPSSDVDASTDEVTAVFAPQTGALAAMEQQLAKLVVKQGKVWVANPESQDSHPTEDFLRFLNRMQSIQDALFADGSPQLKMHYSLRPVPEQNVDAVTLDIDGHKFTTAKGAAQSQAITWPGSGQVVVTVKAGGNFPFGAYSGPWAVWRWMYDSDTRPSGNKVAQWSMLRQGKGQAQAPTDAQGHPIVLRVEITEFPSGVDIFDRGLFSFRCPSQVAQ
jgi:type VI secretion system protein ImpL